MLPEAVLMTDRTQHSVAGVRLRFCEGVNKLEFDTHSFFIVLCLKYRLLSEFIEEEFIKFELRTPKIIYFLIFRVLF